MNEHPEYLRCERDVIAWLSQRAEEAEQRGDPLGMVNDLRAIRDAIVQHRHRGASEQ